MSGPLKNVLRAYPSQLKLFVVDVVLGVVWLSVIYAYFNIFKSHLGGHST
jgi:hypothetical protein